MNVSAYTYVHIHIYECIYYEHIYINILPLFKWRRRPNNRNICSFIYIRKWICVWIGSTIQTYICMYVNTFKIAAHVHTYVRFICMHANEQVCVIDYKWSHDFSICICTYIYVCTSLYVCYICTCARVSILNANTHVSRYVHTRTYAFKCTFKIYLFVHAYVCKCMQALIKICSYLSVHTYNM